MNGRANVQAKNTPTPVLAFTPVPSGLLQRKCGCGQHTIAGGECAECSTKKLSLQRRAAPSPNRGEGWGEGQSVPPIVHEVLRSRGQPLDPGIRAFFEPRFGHDFSQVRVHTGVPAAQSAQAVNALAYTVGRDVVFGSNQYAPDTIGGRTLLSHELAHVVQQSNGARTTSNLVIGGADDVYEREVAQVESPLGGHRSGQHIGSIHPHPGSAIRLQRQLDPNAPPAMAAGPSGALLNGQVVNVEIRDASGVVTEFSHEYPIDWIGNIEIPTAGYILASGNTLVQLRQAIVSAFSASILVNPTVNVSLSSKTVTYTRRVGVGDTLRIRVLQGDGKVDPSTGSYSVDSAGKLHVPFVGDIDAAGKTIADLEDQIERGIRGGFIVNAVVHVSQVQLNS